MIASPEPYRLVSGGLEGGIHLEVQRVIRSTGQFVDDLTARYFQSFHRHLPIISRLRFQNSLIASGGNGGSGGPAADSSVLLLSICLLATTPVPTPGEDGERPLDGVTDRQALYLSAKALLAQVQGSLHRPSLHLIQAILLLAGFEYASGRPETAFVTIAGCAREAYAAGIHNRTSTGRGHCDRGLGLRADDVDEAWNTWWGIVVYER